MKWNKMGWIETYLLFLCLSSCDLNRADPCVSRVLNFMGNDLVYYDDGSGKVFKEGTKDCLLHLRDCSFRKERLHECVYSHRDFERLHLTDLLSTIGFPRFLGSTAYELDFGRKDDNIVRFSFGNGRIFAFESMSYDGKGEAWLTKNANVKPSIEDAQKLKADMSLDEVIQLLGKPRDFSDRLYREFWWDTVEGKVIYCSFSPRQGRKDKHVFRLDHWRPVPEAPMNVLNPEKKGKASSSLPPPIWESEPPSRGKNANFISKDIVWNIIAMVLAKSSKRMGKNRSMKRRTLPIEANLFTTPYFSMRKKGT